MALDAELAAVEAAALKARSVRDFLTLVDALRAVDPDDVEAALVLIRRAAEARGLGAVLAAAMQRSVAPAVASTLGVVEAAVAASVAAELEARVRKDATRAARELDARVRASVAAAQLLAAGRSPVDVMRAPLLGAATSVRAILSTEVTQTAAAIVTSISDEAGVATVWVAETNACVECLAYSGVTAEPGELFPEGLTYGRRPRATEPVAMPPLHPNCRCIVEPLGSQEYADALRREADRSVLRGFSLESESMATRVDAAERLLERGVDAPASVIAYAERSVAAGRFATRDRPDR